MTSYPSLCGQKQTNTGRILVLEAVVEIEGIFRAPYKILSGKELPMMCIAILMRLPFKCEVKKIKGLIYLINAMLLAQMLS